MKQLFISQDGSFTKSFSTLIKIITILLFVLILMNGGTVVVNLARVAYQAIEGIFVSLLLSIVLVYLLKPAINVMERFNFTRTVSISIIYLVIFLSLGSIFGTLIPVLEKQVLSIKSEFPMYKEKFSVTFTEKEKRLKDKYPFLANVNISESASNYIKNEYLGKNQSDLIISSSRVIGSFITILILVPFITFFLLKDGLAMKRAIISMVPNRYFEMTLNIFYGINQQLGGFIRARLLEALCVGLTCFIGLSILNVRYAAVLAIIAGLTNLIPYIGPIIGAVPALLVAFMDSGNWAIVLWVVIIYTIAQLLDMLIIIPAVFAKIVDMHPLVVVIVIIVGGQLGGIIGMILAVPIYSITKVTIKEIYTGLTSLRT